MQSEWEAKNMNKSRIFVITGPTATGKTQLGVLVSGNVHGEIVSADSMQIYRRMDIGTAKPTAAEMGNVPHHMIDCAEPTEPWSVALWTERAAAVCDRLLSEGKTPVVVGGTGLYIDSLVSGRSFADSPEDKACRRELEERYDEIGGAAMLRELSQLDPERAAKLAPRDKKRIVRAYEVFLLTGKTITRHDEETRALPPRYEARTVALDFENRADLYARIDLRVDEMIARGLFAEVESLLASGVPDDCTAMQAIGYKEAAMALRGEISREEAVGLIKTASRRYAKRQLTWLRGRENVHWIRWGSEPDFAAAARDSTEFFLRDE